MWWRRAFSPRREGQKSLTISHKTLACNSTLPEHSESPNGFCGMVSLGLVLGDRTFQL